MSSRLRLRTWCIAVAVLVLAHINSTSAVWPRPASMQIGDTGRIVAGSFSIRFTEQGEQQHDTDLQSAIRRAMTRIESLAVPMFIQDKGFKLYDEAKKGEELMALVITIGDKSKKKKKMDKGKKKSKSKSMHKKAVTSNYEKNVRDLGEILHGGSSVYFEKRKQPMTSAADSMHGTISKMAVKPLGKVDESYTLKIDKSGPATIEATTALGALRGLSTFVQLVHRCPNERSSFVTNVPIEIHDKPAFPYRGIMLDTSRNFLDVQTIKDQLNAMELLKMSQLHWHITDTASWPLGLQSKDLGTLAREGAYGSDMVYSPEIIKYLVHYAAKRGINIIMEIDMPGHQYMGVAQYPGDLITCGNVGKWTTVGAEPPTGHLDIRKPGATTLMKDIFTELATYLPGQYLSTGNDEVEPTCYGLKKEDTAGMDKLLAPFVDSVHSHLVSLGKTPMVWEEAALNFPETAEKLKEGTIIEAWTSSQNVGKILQSNSKALLVHAPSDFFYMDCGMGDFLGNNPGGASWCPYVTWQKQYAFDPYNGTQGIANGKERVMGGESALWAEQTDSANLESLLWPRAAAGAEVFWTGADYSLNGKQQHRSASDALPRLNEARARLRKLGIRAAPIQPQWCAYRPGMCDMS